MALHIDSWRGGGTGQGEYILKAGSASQVPVTAQGATGQTANIFNVKNSAGTVLFSVDPSGNVSLAGSISAVINETVTGDLTLTGSLTVNGASTMNGNVTLGDIQTDTLTVNAISTFKSMVTLNTDLIGNIVQLQEQGVDPANGANVGKVYSKEVSGITELFYIDSSSNITQITAAGAEVVAGPVSSTDNAAARWDGTTGRLLQNSIVIIGDNVAGSNIIDVAAPITTTGNVIDVGDADSLTTGGILNLVSNSSSTGLRNLVTITNDNTAATSTACLRLNQDAAVDVLVIDQNGNGACLTFLAAANTSTDVISIGSPAATTGNIVNATPTSLTTGSIIRGVSSSNSTSTRSLLFLNNSGTLATGCTIADFQQNSVARVVFVDQNTDARSVEIDSESTTASVIYVDTPVTSTGNVLDITTANSLTTGRIASLISNSADTGTRTLVQITNDNTLATGATCLSIQQDAIQNAITMTGGGTTQWQLLYHGGVTVTQLAVAAGVSSLSLTPGAHTALTAEVIDVNLTAHTVTLTDGTTIALARSVVVNATTYNGVAAGGTETVTTAIGLEVGVPVQGTNLTLTNAPITARFLSNVVVGNILTPAAGPTNTLFVGSGTAPSSTVADSVAFYSSDISAGNTEPSFYCEGTSVLATGQADSASSVRVRMRINGTEVTLLAI